MRFDVSNMNIATALAPTVSIQPTPFIKWAGGKTRLLSQYETFMPASWNHYHEPFLGGGAVFFNLSPDAATLSDINGRLIETYTAVRDDVEAVIMELARLRERHGKEQYYRSRTRFNQARGLGAVERAALFIYLNKTCFNGLYRENRRGQFNVPVGSYRNPRIFNEDQLRAASRALAGVELRVSGFSQVLERAQPGDFVYFDPPYVPLSSTSSFTSYARGGFDIKMQEDLAEVFGKLVERGCHVRLSNSDTPIVRELYSKWDIEVIRAPRMINSNARKRGCVNEVLVIG